MAFGVGLPNQDVIFRSIASAATLSDLVCGQMWTETSRREQRDHSFVASSKVSNSFHSWQERAVPVARLPASIPHSLAPDHIGVTSPRHYASLSQRNSTTATAWTDRLGSRSPAFCLDNG